MTVAKILSTEYGVCTDTEHMYVKFLGTALKLLGHLSVALGIGPPTPEPARAWRTWRGQGWVATGACPPHYGGNRHKIQGKVHRPGTGTGTGTEYRDPVRTLLCFFSSASLDPRS